MAVPRRYGLMLTTAREREFPWNEPLTVPLD
jgi:hypothetical protein